MIIWLDAQLPPKLAHWIKFKFNIETYPLSELGLRDAKDIEIFNKARLKDIIIMTKDRDFIDLHFRFGAPPKIIVLNCGNLTNRFLQSFLENKLEKALSILQTESIVEIG